MERNYKIDNIRFILIFLVVLGHFFECFNGTNNLYRIIYSFHMPAFLFISGYFAKFSIKKIVFHYMYIYILFQILYSIFLNIPLQFTTPYWLLWYLFVIFFYYLLIPGFSKQNNFNQLAIICITVLISLLAGFINNIGYHMSLSRLFTFLPYFFIGYFIGHNEKSKDFLYNKLAKNSICKIISVLLVIISAIYIYLNVDITSNILYGSYSYELANYNPLIKLELLIISFSWILFLFIWISDKKVDFISNFGQNTLFIFLFHGFIVILAKKYIFFSYSFVINLILAVLLTLLIILLFGNKVSTKFLNKVFNGNWILNLCNRIFIK